MKKQFNQLISSYFLNSSLWLMTMLLTLSLLPAALKAVMMLIRQNALPVWMVLLFDLTGWIIAWIFFFIAVWEREGHHRTKFLKGFWRFTVKGSLWLIATAALSNTSYQLFLTYGSRLAAQGMALAYTIGQLLMILLISILMSAVAFWLMCMLADPEYGTSFPKALKLWLRKPVLLLGSVLSAAAVLFAVPLLYDYMLKIFPGLALSFLEIVSGAIILAILQWVILSPILDAMFRNAAANLSVLTNAGTGTGRVANVAAGTAASSVANTAATVVNAPNAPNADSAAVSASIPSANSADKGENAPNANSAAVGANAPDVNPAATGANAQAPNTASGQGKPVPFALRYISILAAVAIIAASGIYTLITGAPLSPISAVKKDIEYYINYGKLMSKAGDPAAAAYYEKIAEARVLAWQGILCNDNNLLYQAAVMAPSDEQAQLLFAVRNPGLLEQGLLNSDHSKAWYIALLDEYAKAGGNLSDVQKLRRSELLRLCILQGYYCQTSIMPVDVEAKQDAFDKMLKEFDDDIIAGKQYALIARIGEDGGVTRQLAMDALDLAEKYTMSMELQFLAMTYGSAWQDDSGSHYGRTADAAMRYDGLYMQLKAKKATEDEIIQGKLTVAKALLTCKQTQAAAEFLSSLNYKNTELSALKASCLFALKSYDKCLETVTELLEDSPQNPQALYLAANCTLHLGQIEDSIRYASTLSGLVQNGENKIETESLLYPYLLRFTIGDGTARYNNETYSKLTEQQLNLMKENEFFYNYMTAAHLWAMNNNDSRAEALVLLDKVLAAGGELSRAQYIKGAIYFEMGDDAKALENLKASLEIDDRQPAAWYAMANLYDRMQMYEEAYSACQKVLQYLPSTDHAYDVFGISIHASGLMDKLKPYIKEVE